MVLMDNIYFYLLCNNVVLNKIINANDMVNIIGMVYRIYQVYMYICRH